MQSKIEFYCLLSKSHLFKVERDIVDALVLTDNKLDHARHKLPFPIIFIDCYIPIISWEFEDGKIASHYNGILLFEVRDSYNEDEFIPLKNLQEMLPKKGELSKFYMYGYEGEIPSPDPYLYIGNTGTDVTTAPEFKDEKKQIEMFVANFLDFINDPEVELVDEPNQVYTNKIRKRKGLSPIPPSKIITLKGKIKEYVAKIRTGATFTYSHRFWVRGHWRELRSDIFTNKRNTRIWIPPYIKGNGVLLQKEYDLIPEKEVPA
jgi:hypothetical protein